MAIFSSKHGKREQSFFVHNFPDGLNQEIAPSFLPNTALSQCKNMKYGYNQSPDGQKTVIIKKRQGTEKISGTAHSAALRACTYYIADSHYIVADSSKVYELNSSTFAPVELGSISGTPTFTEFNGKLIIHDSGVTKAWNGTTFETLTCLYTDELIETGDGSTTEFAGSIANPAVNPGEFDVSYTDSTAKSIADDGNGRLTGDVSSAVVKNIGGASKTSPCEITCTAHGFSTGDVINIQSVGGMTQLNNITFTITKTGDNTFTLDGINSTAYTDYTSGGTASGNAIRYSSGAYLFTCSGAPDNTTPVYATYEKVSGAPKSKAGFVRASRLYVWGDSDNASRLWYSAPNDEDAWDSSSGGGYLDIDKLDGESLISCINFFSSVVAMKNSTMHRIDGFPGDNTFRVEPMVANSGNPAYRACLTYGNYIAYLAGKQGLVSTQPTNQYGDLSQYATLSGGFQSFAARFANSSAYMEHNQVDNQLWLTLYNGATQLTEIYVINLETGNQLSIYEFAFAHTCYKYVNNEMLIGGSDGHLYRLYNDNAKYLDNDVSYDSDTFVRGAMTNWGMPFNRKHNKRIYVQLYGSSGLNATFNLYTDEDFDTPVYTKSVDLAGGNPFIFRDGQDILIFSMDTIIGAPVMADRDVHISKKFNYKSLMFELTGIGGLLGAEFYGVDFTGAIIGY